MLCWWMFDLWVKVLVLMMVLLCCIGMLIRCCSSCEVLMMCGVLIELFCL